MEITEKKMREMFQDFGKTLKQELKKELSVELGGGIAQMISDNNRIIVDLLRQDIKASENRMIARMDAISSDIRKEMSQTKDEIVNGFYDVVDNGILPQIGKLDYRVTRIEKKMGLT